MSLQSKRNRSKFSNHNLTIINAWTLMILSLIHRMTVVDDHNLFVVDMESKVQN